MFNMVDMAHTPEDIKKEYAGNEVMPAILGNANKYPYGLCISLGQDELEKLNMEADCEVGDYIHLVAMAKVTSVSQREEMDGDKNCRIELQITHLGLENETEEAEEFEEKEDKVKKPASANAIYGKMYNNNGGY